MNLYDLRLSTPTSYNNDVKRAKLGVRIAGIVCILIGLLIRYLP